VLIRENKKAPESKETEVLLMPEFRFVVPVEVRFRDLDALGHVNSAVYITYFEVARSKYWTDLFGIQSYQEFGFLVVRTECNYRSPAHFGETLAVAARVSELRNSSFVFEYEILEEKSSRLIADGKSVQACFDMRGGKAVPIPPGVRQRISEFEGLS
jgi:acyl-CoA thioester hydrolase